MPMSLLYTLLFLLSLIIIASYLIRSKGTIPKIIWRPFYNWLAAFNIRTMNYGYSDLVNDPSRQTSLKNEEKKDDYFSIRLYEEVAQLEKLPQNASNEILEIGCGRGGGLYYLAKKFPHFNFTGVDISNQGIEQAKKNFSLPNLKFTVGSAINLPFANDVFNAIINIESSHCYPDFKQFITESRRTLKNNGLFFYADFQAGTFTDIQDQLEILSQQDITKNVLDALNQNQENRNKQFKEVIKDKPFIKQGLLKLIKKQFAADQNSLIKKSFEQCRTIYQYIQAKKVNSRPIPPPQISSRVQKRTITLDSLATLNNDVTSHIETIYQAAKQLQHKQPANKVIETNQPYSRELLKNLSVNFTEPVLFTNAEVPTESFALPQDIQINRDDTISKISREGITEQHTIFNQVVSPDYFPQLNHIFNKERLHYDFFDTPVGKKTSFHNELNGSINLQHRGEKKWLLINPKYSFYLIPFPIEFNHPGYRTFVSIAIGQNILPSHSIIPSYGVTMKPGYLLFIPSWWWHQTFASTHSSHIAIRVIHSKTAHHPLFKPNPLYRYAWLLPYILKHTHYATIPTDNTSINDPTQIIQMLQETIPQLTDLAKLYETYALKSEQ